jgi:hypothetical protein
VLLLWGGPGSVVGIATAYGLDGPGIDSVYAERSHGTVGLCERVETECCK